MLHIILALLVWNSEVLTALGFFPIMTHAFDRQTFDTLTRATKRNKKLLENIPPCQNLNSTLEPEWHDRPKAVEQIIAQLVSCGVAVIAPGMLPHLTDSYIESMTAFLKDLIDKDIAMLGSRTFELNDIGSTLFAKGGMGVGRYDIVPPWPKKNDTNASGPFGLELLQVMFDLEDILVQLLGDDIQLGFLSALSAKAGANEQRFHRDGGRHELKDGYCCFSQVLKVQIILHDLQAESGMIHFLNPSASGKYHMDAHVPSAIPSEYVSVPMHLSTGSVILYSPLAVHAGGANLGPHHKFVLDAVFCANTAFYQDNGEGCYDSTPTRWSKQSPRGYNFHRRYVEKWSKKWRSKRSKDEL